MPSPNADEVVPGDDLVGIWGSETIDGPRLRGELTLVRENDRWHASIGGVSGTAPVARDSVRVVLPGGEGELRVPAIGAGTSMRAFWIQPIGNLTFVPYATPLTLQRVAANAWRGTVAPLDDRWTLHLQVRREQDGSLRGAFRNPEINWRGGASWYRLTRDGDTLRFSDLDSNVVRLTVPYDSAQRRLTMDFGRPVVLTPRSRDRAIAFFPRTPAESSYAYRAPLAREDGWATASARQVGMSEDRLRELVQRIATTDPTGPGAPAIHSVLVARRGKLVLEEYFHGFDATRLHDLRSASKTLTSVMVGVAIDRGAVRNIDAPVAAFFPYGRDLVSAEPRKGSITLAHLLTHSSGLACDDNADESPGGEGQMQTQRSEPDWHRYLLALSVVHNAGSTYAYCSGGLNLAAGVVARATGNWLPHFFDQHIAAPLQITQYAINLTPAGDAYGGGGIQLRPRDLLKFGQAFLDGGVWNGRRLVSEDWVKRSTAHQIAVPNGTLKRWVRRIWVAPPYPARRWTELPGIRSERQWRPVPDRDSRAPADRRLHCRQLPPVRHLAEVPRRAGSAIRHSGDR